MRNKLKKLENTSLFPQDMIQELFSLHCNTIHKSTFVTWRVGPYKLIGLPGQPSLNLTNSSHTKGTYNEVHLTNNAVHNNNSNYINQSYYNNNPANKNKQNYNSNPDYNNKRNN